MHITAIKPGLLSKEFDARIAEHSALRERAIAAKEAHREAQDALVQARDADDRAAAIAVRKGDVEPGLAATTAAQATLDARERDVRILGLAVEDGELALTAEIEAMRPEFMAALEGQLDKKRTQVLTLLSKLQETLGAGDELRAVAKLVDPTRERRSLAGWRGLMQGLVDQWERPYSVDVLVSKLAEHFRVDPRVKAAGERLINGIRPDAHAAVEAARQTQAAVVDGANRREAADLLAARRNSLGVEQEAAR
jgi:hypothetical protein